MQQIKKSIIPVLTNAQKIAHIVKSYLENIRNYVLGSNPGLLKIYDNFINLAENYKLPDTKDVVVLMNDYYNFLKHIIPGTEAVKELLQNKSYQRAINYGMSGSFMLSLENRVNEIETEIDNFTKLYKEVGEKIIPLAIEQVDIKNIIWANMSITRFTVALVTKYATVDLVERFKNKILGAKRNLLERTLMTPQRLIGGILPSIDSVYQSYETIKSLDSSTILIHQQIGGKYDYRYAGLVSPEYIVQHKLQQPLDSGLNSAILARFMTIKKLKETTANFNNNVRILGSTHSEYFTICDTPNGHDYRILGKKVPRSRLLYIIKGPNSRPVEYANLQTDVIMTRIFDQQAPNILTRYAESQYTPPSTAQLREEIRKELQKEFEKRYESIDIKTASIETIIQNSIMFPKNPIISNILVKNQQRDKESDEYRLTQNSKIIKLVESFNIKFADFLQNTQINLLIMRELDNPKPYFEHLFNAALEDVMEYLDRQKLLADADILLKNFVLESKII